MGYLLGIDIGTYGSKAVIVTESGRIVARAGREHELSIPASGRAEHDAQAVWWADLVALTKELLSVSGVAPQEISGIGTSAIAPCVLPVAADGRPLRPAILYGIDTRATTEVEELTATLGDSWLQQHCGSDLSSQSAGPKILWLQHNEPEVWKRTWKVMSSTTYLVYRLTGNVVLDNYTAAFYAPLFDIHTLKWSEKALGAICPAEKLPETGWTTEIAGQVTADAARETGLAEGTPVVTGTADAASEAVSAGVWNPGSTMLMYGSSLFIISVAEKLSPGGVFWPAPYLFPGTYALAGGMSTTGSVTQWYRRNFAPAAADQAAMYQELSRRAAAVPAGSEGIIVLPYFSGERTPINDPAARGVVAGLSLHHSDAHFYRAILEGVAYGIRHNLEAMKNIGADTRTLAAVGGGTKNAVWMQIVCDVLGLPQLVHDTPGAAFGDAALAALAVGAVSDRDKLAGWIDTGSELTPDPANGRIYHRLYPQFRALYEASKQSVHALAREQQRSAAEGADS